MLATESNAAYSCTDYHAKYDVKRADSSMFEQAFKNIEDVLWKEAGYTTELDYTEQTSWLLFLKYLDGLVQDKSDEAALEGKKFTFILEKPNRKLTHRSPEDIINEIAALDTESAEVLGNIRALLKEG